MGKGQQLKAIEESKQLLDPNDVSKDLDKQSFGGHSTAYDGKYRGFNVDL